MKRSKDDHLSTDDCQITYRLPTDDQRMTKSQAKRRYDAYLCEASRDDRVNMTRCKQWAHLLPTRFLDIFFITNAKFFAPLHFLHACRMLPHSSVTTSDHRQDVINVLWQKTEEKAWKKMKKR